MAAKVVLPPEYQTWFALHDVDTGIRRVIENELRKFGISAPAAGLMYVLQSSEEPVKLKELSQWLFLKPNSVSELVSRMAKRGLVKKVRDQQKKGMIRVKLTKRGDDLLRQYMKEMKVVSMIMSGLSEKEPKALTSCLEKLRKSVLELMVANAVEDRLYG